MDVKDFSLEFDLLYNNIMSNKAPGLSEYEKSLFLTQAQELIVLDIYSGKYQEHFEETEKMSMCLDQLIRQETYTSFSTGKRLDVNSVFITLPDDLWFKTGEVAYIKDDSYKLAELYLPNLFGYDAIYVVLVPTYEPFWANVSLN